MKVKLSVLFKFWRAGRGVGSASHSIDCYVDSPLSGTDTRERKQYCPEGKVCASNLTSHVRTLPGVETKQVCCWPIFTVQPATAAITMPTLHSPARAPERGSSIAQRGRSARAT